MIKFLPSHVSMYNNCHLRDAIRAAVAPTVVEGIGAGADAHRLLLIGTTNADVGSGRIFDLGREAHRQPAAEAREAIVRTLLASSAIAGVFPPVEIDGMLDTDGGATSNLFVAAFPGPDGPAAQFMARHPGAVAPKVRAWIVVNQQLKPQHAVAQPKWIDVTNRSLGTPTSTSQLFALALLRDMAVQASQERGLDVEVRLVAIPDETPKPRSKDLFDKPYMLALQELGRAMGADPSSWQEEIPAPYGVDETWAGR
jgi:predicted acylesterase/phospholipase RssA